MAEITLEKIDLVRERTGVSYAEARDILILCEGDVVEALIYIENRNVKDKKDIVSEFTASAEEFKEWIKETIRKGNVTRIKVKKEGRTIVDVPVNAGISIGILTLISPLLAAAGIFTAIITAVRIEITKNDGSTEVVNTIIKNAVDDIACKVNEAAEGMKDKFKKDECCNKSENEDICDAEVKKEESGEDEVCIELPVKEDEEVKEDK